jgi:hypothetical protein
MAKVLPAEIGITLKDTGGATAMPRSSGFFRCFAFLDDFSGRMRRTVPSGGKSPRGQLNRLWIRLAAGLSPLQTLVLAH